MSDIQIPAAASTRRSLARLALPALAVTALSASSALAVDAYSLGNGGATLLKYSTSNPGSVSAVDLTGGSATFGALLDSIDAQPGTGQLYGYLSAANEYYLINPTTGALTKTSAASVGAGATSFANGLDFNPTSGRLHLTDDANNNITYNTATGTATAGPTLTYASGDQFAGTTPSIIDTAFINNYVGASSTTQYALDYTQNSLATLNAATGQLSTVGQVTLGGSTFDLDSFAGFDVYTDGSHTNTAYAFLFNGAADGLYAIDLSTGAATLVGFVNDSAYGDVYSLAVVPEPTSIAAIAGIGLLGLRRRK